MSVGAEPEILPLPCLSLRPLALAACDSCCGTPHPPLRQATGRYVTFAF